MAEMANYQGVALNVVKVRDRSILYWRRLRRPLFLLGLVAADLLTPVLAFAIAYSLRYGSVPFADSLLDVLSRPGTQLALSLVSVAYVLMLRQAGIYQLHRTWLPLDLVIRIVLTTSVATLLLSVAGYGQASVFGSRAFLAYYWLIATTMAFATKLGARIVVLAMLCFGIGVKKVVLVGSTQNANRLLQTIRLNPQLGYRVTGLMYRGGDNPVLENVSAHGVRSGSASQVSRRLLDLNPDLIIIATSARKSDELLNLIADCTAQGIEVRLVPEFFEVYSSKLQVDRLGIIPLVHLRPLKVPVMSAAVKRTADLVGALSLLPLFGVVYGWRSLRAARKHVPVLQRMRVAGLKGRPFDLLLFHPDTGAGATGERAMWNAFPQVMNVLKGDMSLVGPRPSDLERALHYNSWERRILAVRPGMVGFNAAADGQLVASSDQLAWDVAYLDNQSLAFDFNVLVSGVVRAGASVVRG
ncbi:MAG: hypothetical protein AMXMBFR84_30600 [Candidatus Hydrogenedentota bacterium]